MEKVAKLVTCSLMTRIVVDKDATEEEILNAVKDKFITKIKDELSEHIEDIEDDEDCPYDPDYDEDQES